MEKPARDQDLGIKIPGQSSGQFAKLSDIQSKDVEAGLDANEYEYPPTRFDVEEAKARLDSFTMTRPMYRGDWERINGGSGPTVAQARAEAEDRGSIVSMIADARADYERMLAAWEASDKSQDDDVYRCDYCGDWYDSNDGDCPCGN